MVLSNNMRLVVFYCGQSKFLLWVGYSFTSMFSYECGLLLILYTADLWSVMWLGLLFFFYFSVQSYTVMTSHRLDMQAPTSKLFS